MAKPRVGRPPKPRAEVSSELVKLRVTAIERAAWEDAVGEQTLSAWIRDVCNRAASR